MILVLAPRAGRDLRAIAAHINHNNPLAAQAIIASIVASIEILSEQPLLGRKVNAQGVRRILVPRTPYIAYYRIAGEEVMILHVRDGRRKPFAP